MLSIEEIEQLKAENERLKREYNILDGIIDVNNAKIGQLEKENKSMEETIDGLLSIQYTLADNGVKLDKALQEIKEIAEKDFNHTCWEDYAEQLKQILQKISECEVNE